MDSIKHNIIAAMVAIVLVVPLMFWASDRSPPHMTIGGVTVPPEIHRGETYRIEWRVESISPRCEGTVYRYLRDSSGKVWVEAPTPAAFGLLPENTNHVVGSAHVMPINISLGNLDIIISTEYVCNFTQYLWPIRLKYPIVHTVVLP